MPHPCDNVLSCCAPNPFEYVIEEETDPCADVSPLEILTTELPDGNEDEPYSFQLEASGGSGVYVWEITSGELPNGLTMDESGLITGTPTESTTVEITVKLSDAGCTISDATTDLTITTNPADPCGTPPPAVILAYYNCDDVAYPALDSVAGKNLVDGLGLPFPDVQPGIIDTGFFGNSGAVVGFRAQNTDAQWDLSAEDAFTMRAWFWYSGTFSTGFDTRVGVQGRAELIMFDPLLGPYFKFQVVASGSYTHRHYGAIGGVGWHRVVAVLRKDCGTTLKIDNEPSTFFPFPAPVGVQSGGNVFEINAPNTGAYPKTGVDEVGVWVGAWTEAQMLFDWNGGAGRTYPDVP